MIANKEGRRQTDRQPKALSAQASRSCWPLATEIRFLPLALDPCQTSEAILLSLGTLLQVHSSARGSRYFRDAHIWAPLLPAVGSFEVGAPGLVNVICSLSMKVDWAGGGCDMERTQGMNN